MTLRLDGLVIGYVLGLLGTAALHIPVTPLEVAGLMSPAIIVALLSLYREASK